jgi:ribosomal protein S18 acetylase RimI-like enzyme
MRLACNSDAEAIWSLISGVLNEYGMVADRDTSERDLVNVDQSYNKAGGVFMVLADGNKLVGTVALSRHSDTTCELCRMYLAANYRGMGLGRLLLETGLKLAAERGFNEIRLKTAAVLKEAIGLYRSAGFAATNEAACSKNCNLVMVKYLTPQKG